MASSSCGFQLADKDCRLLLDLCHRSALKPLGLCSRHQCLASLLIGRDLLLGSIDGRGLGFQLRLSLSQLSPGLLESGAVVV